MNEELQPVIQSCQNDLLIYCMLTDPDFVVGPHHRLMANELMGVYHGINDRLMIFMAPRSGKSYMTSRHFPAWALGHKPSWQLICSSYSKDLAMDFSREVRNDINSDTFQSIFPGVELRPDSRAANRWHTNRKGIFTSVGVGSGVAGRGANLALIDDPISEQDAYSKAAREAVIRWYPGGLRTRLMPNGRIVLTMTRWHEMDLAGWLLDQESNGTANADKWRIVRIPAILDEEAATVLEKSRIELIEEGILHESYPEMKEGQTYWPVTPENEMKDTGLRGWKIEEMLRTKDNSPPHQWQALYMQRPMAEEGNIIRRSWWQSWEEEKPPKCEYVIISCDTAFESTNDSDYSAFTVWGIFRSETGTPNLIMLGAERGRWDFPTVRRKAYDMYQDWNPDTFLIEKRSSGHSLIQEFRNAGIPVIDWLPGNEKDKLSRAHAITGVMSGGRIWAPTKKRWCQEVLHECSIFPAGEHDDYMDTVTMTLLWVKDSGLIQNPADYWQNDDYYDRMRERNRGFYF